MKKICKWNKASAGKSKHHTVFLATAYCCWNYYTNNGRSLISLSSIFNLNKTISFFFFSVAWIRLLRTARMSSRRQFKALISLSSLFTCLCFVYFLFPKTNISLEKASSLKVSFLNNRPRIQKTAYKVKCKHVEFQLTYM